MGRRPASSWLPEPTAEGPQTFNNVQEPNVQASSQTISGPPKKQENVIDNQEEKESIETDSSKPEHMQKKEIRPLHTYKGGKIIFLSFRVFG